MKKIFALLLAAGTFTATLAQQPHGAENRNVSRDINYGKSNSSDGYNNHAADISYNTKTRDAEINNIRRSYDQKIRMVKSEHRLRPFEKNRQIAILEKQRDQQIERAFSDFANRNNRYDDRMANNRRRN